MRKCEECGIRFDPVQQTQRFCSGPCRTAAGNRKRFPKHYRGCDGCGQEFLMKMPHQRFCTPACRRRYMQGLRHYRQYQCAECGGMFERLATEHVVKYCSEGCRAKARVHVSPNGPTMRNRRLTREMRLWQDRLEEWRELNIEVVTEVGGLVASEDKEVQEAIERFLAGGGVVLRYPLMESSEDLAGLRKDLEEFGSDE